MRNVAIPKILMCSYFYLFYTMPKVGTQVFFVVRKSQIRKFLGYIH
jgi:hypothetical protein